MQWRIVSRMRRLTRLRTTARPTLRLTEMANRLVSPSLGKATNTSKRLCQDLPVRLM